MKTRVYFLDNLRTFLIFLVVLLHSGLVYEPVLEGTWIVIDPDQASSIGLLRMYLDLFVMFVMFFISGFFIPFSIKNKSSWEFIKSKFNRIMIPWIIAVLTLIPAYKVLFLYSRGLPQQEWYSYFHFFQRTGGNMTFFADNPVQNWLWFLPVLFLFQIAYLILSRTNLLSLRISLKTAVTLLVVIGLGYSIILSEAGLKGWFHSAVLHFQRERLLVYFMAFMLGSLCNKLKVFESDEKNMKYYVIANMMLTFSIGIFTVFALNLFFNLVDPSRNYFIISSFMDRAVYYLTAILSMVSFLYILLHVFKFNFNKINTIMKQLNKSSYSVYIIHVIVMGVIAMVLVHFQLPGIFKFIILTLLTYMISNLIAITYYRWFQQNVSLKVGTFTVLVVSLFAFIQLDNKSITVDEKAQSYSEQSIGLHEAVITGNLQAVQDHVNAGSDIDIKDPTGGSSPLITAAVFGKTEMALALIKAGADLNFKNSEGSTPLHTAAFFCRTEIVEVLLAKGADKTIKNNAGSTALNSVEGPFEHVKPIYDYFSNAFGSMGLVLNDEYLKSTRPAIAKMLQG